MGTPHGRGYQSSLHYFHHANDYWTSKTGTCGTKPNKVGIVDLWDTDGPAHGQNNSGSCSQDNQEGCVYEDQIFADKVVSAIKGREKNKPFFIFWAPHIVHTPLQVPQAHLDHFAFIKESHRQFYHAMVYFVDEAIGNVTRLLRSEGLWDDTLIVLHADNGGPIYDSGSGGANNYPLRGGKYSNFEGGIRVNAFASGGYLPKAVRGSKLEGMIHVADWYRTLAQGIAGLDPTDHWAAESGLPPIDSLDVWPMLSGQNLTSPRESILVTNELIVVGDWKYVKGGADMIEAARGGPHYPNASTATDPIDKHNFKCPAQGCLYNVVEDPHEE